MTTLRTALKTREVTR